MIPGGSAGFRPQMAGGSWFEASSCPGPLEFWWVSSSGCAFPAKWPGWGFYDGIQMSFLRVVGDSPDESSSTQSLVLRCFVNQRLDPFAWSVNQKSRSNVSSFGGRTARARKRPKTVTPGERSPRTISIPLKCDPVVSTSSKRTTMSGAGSALHQRWNSAQHVRQALAPSAWNCIRSLHRA